MLTVFVTHSLAPSAAFDEMAEQLLGGGGERVRLVRLAAQDEAAPQIGPADVEPELRELVAAADVVVVLSAMWQGEADWVRAEVAIAREEGVPIVVAAAPGASPPAELVAAAAAVVPAAEAAGALRPVSSGER